MFACFNIVGGFLVNVVMVTALRPQPRHDFGAFFCTIGLPSVVIPLVVSVLAVTGEGSDAAVIVVFFI